MLEELEYEGILADIKQCLNAEDLDMKKIKKCLNADDFLMQCGVIEQLAQFVPNETIEKLILKHINHKNYLVRCEVYEALERSISKLVLGEIFDKIKSDKSSMSRMYAVTTFVELVKKIEYEESMLEELKKLFKKEEAKNVIVAYFALFYQIEGDMKYILELLNYLNDENIDIRCNVVHTLSYVMDEKNKEIIRKAYRERYLIETSRCVQSTLKDYI